MNAPEVLTHPIGSSVASIEHSMQDFYVTRLILRDQSI